MSLQIVVGIEDDPTGRYALDGAVQLARDLEAELTLVHALTKPMPLESNEDRGTLDVVTWFRWGDHGDAVALSQVAEKLRAKGLVVHTVVEFSQPDTLILDVANRIGAAFIVVGTHGKTGLSRIAFGSVAESVVRRSRRPVLVVPGPIEEPAPGDS